jgi:hypothetical protein
MQAMIADQGHQKFVHDGHHKFSLQNWTEAGTH